MTDLVELSLSIYIFNSIIGYTGFLLFNWWWRKVRSASFVYKCITFIYLFWGIQNSIAAVSRYFFIIDDFDALRHLLDSPWWGYRTFPTTIIFTIIIIAMIGRILEAIKKDKELKEKLSRMVLNKKQ